MRAKKECEVKSRTPRVVLTRRAGKMVKVRAVAWVSQRGVEEGWRGNGDQAGLIRCDTHSALASQGTNEGRREFLVRRYGQLSKASPCVDWKFLSVSLERDTPRVGRKKLRETED